MASDPASQNLRQMTKEKLDAAAEQTRDGGDTVADKSNSRNSNVLPNDEFENLEGRILGNYKLQKRLGAGGMGSVYMAEHAAMERRVAIKVLSEEFVGDGTALERFRKESKAIGRLDHPNIVRAFDFSSQDSLYYLVMEYVEGTDLEQMVLQSGPLVETLATDYIRQTAHGLAHVHEAGLVHRDIKPANLVVQSDGVVKMLDLGVVRMYDAEDEASLTLEFQEQVLGTVDFLAPEQGLSSHHVDARSDIYSLGCTFYFLLTGRAPFPEGSLAQRMLMHQLHAPEPIPNLRPDVSAELVSLINKMIAKKPEERIQSAAEVAAILDEWLPDEEKAGMTIRMAEKTRISREKGSASEISQPLAEAPAQHVDVQPRETQLDAIPDFNPASPRGPAPASQPAPAASQPVPPASNEPPPLSITERARQAHRNRQARDARKSQEAEERKRQQAQRKARLLGAVKGTAGSIGGLALGLVKQTRVVVKLLVKQTRVVVKLLVIVLVLTGVGYGLTYLAQFRPDTSDNIEVRNHPNGTKAAEGPTVDGQPSGEWTFWTEDGLLEARGAMVAGKRDGHWIHFNAAGGKESDGEYKNDLKEGEWRSWSGDGQLIASGEYHQGTRHGRWVFRYDDGQKRMQGLFRKGQPQGEWSFWYADGTRQAEGVFENGERVGEWKDWDAEGNETAPQLELKP